jgi:excisionase family DNA binding protein
MLNQSKLYSIKDAARTLTISEQTLRNKLCRGEIGYMKIGARTVISEAELMKLVRTVPAAQGES